ncbi:GNAT family N-acetyltransferase [Paenibacillus sp. CN-4]|uniref:GNAT family N-acetyltransferase n=1 Tax=Paenibacillus nanchangensis TaxID=3348343 RepID=UPI00397A1C28
MQVQFINNEEEWQHARHIRTEVFVKEQHVPLEDEFDEYDLPDAECKHILVFYNGEPAGTGRIRPYGNAGKLERICVLAPYRQYGLGRVIISTLEEIAVKEGRGRVLLHGQTQAEGFYHKLGYHTDSEVFMEDGIPHVLLTKELRQFA